MRALELIDFIQDQVPFTYYPNRFPPTSKDICAMVAIAPGMPIDEWTGKKQPSFQILVRGKEGTEAETEEKAHEIFNALANRKNVKIGDESVVIIRPEGSSPIQIGTDEQRRPVFSMNFNTVIRP